VQKFCRSFWRSARNKLAAFGVACFLLGASTLSANTVVPIPGGAGKWYNGVSPNGNPSDAFWDNASRDGSGCNVGYWLDGVTTWGTLLGRCNNDGGISAQTSGYTVPGGPLSYYASTGSAAAPVGWELTASGTNTIQMEVEVAGWRNSNILGYYTYNSSGVMDAITAANVIFNGAVSANSGSSTKTLSFTDGQQFGFYICPKGDCSSGSIMYSGTQYGTSSTKSGKFALFSEDPTNPESLLNPDIRTYWVGVEDLKGSDSVEKWGDYNDLIFRASVIAPTGIPPISVAEPGFYSQFAVNLTGLLAALAFFYYRRQRAVQ